MDLNQLNFTRRRFRSESILYSDYVFGLNTGKNIGEGQYELLKINGDTIVFNPPDNIIDFSRAIIPTEVSFIPFEYPFPGNNILIVYGVNINDTSVPCFTSQLKNSINLQGQNINNGGPGSRLGITLQRSKYNLWAFGGYPGAGGTKSAAGSYFFLFNGTSNKWIDKTELAIKANIPNLVYHTMANVNDEYLIIIGGGSYNSQGMLVDKPFDKVYKFDLNKETWSTTSLVNCPAYTKIGHTTTIINGNLIVIGGTDNQQESKLNIYSDILSINPTTLKCTNINLKYEDGASGSIKRAFHAANYIENYLIINSGINESDSEQQTLLIDTSTWTRKFWFKNLNLINPDLYHPKIEPVSNNNVTIYSAIGVILFFIFIGLLYYIFIIRKWKKKELANIELINGKINNLEPMIEWVRSDSNIVQLDNEAVFALDDKATSRTYTEADKEADLRQLNTLNFAYKNSNSSKQDRISNNIQEFSTEFVNTTLINKASLIEDNTLTSEDLPKN
jgi:hypothetical protein